MSIYDALGFSSSSEVLQLQSKTSRVSIFCFVQFVLLCIAIGTYLMRLSTSSTEVVRTRACKRVYRETPVVNMLAIVLL